MNFKNIILGILVIALASILIGSASAAITSNPDISSNDIWTINEDEASTITITSDNTDVTHYADNVAQFEITAAGVITWTPTNSDVGSFSVTVDALNASEGIEESYTFTTTVVNVNDAPTFTTYDFSDEVTLKETEVFSYTLVATDVDSSTLTYSATGLPSSLTITGDTISGTLVDGDEGVYTATLTVSDSTLTDEETVEFYIKDQYDTGMLTIDDVNFDDLTGDDDKHYPGDIIEIEVEIVNELQDDNMEDVTVHIDCDDLDIDEEIDIDELDEDDSITETIEIQIPYDAEDATHEFKITVSGRDDSDDRARHFGRYFEQDLEDKDLNVRRSNHDVIVSDMTITPDEASAGETVTVKVEVTNIGRKDEDNVKVTIKDSDLDWNKVSDEYDIKEDRDRKFTFDIKIPEDAESKTYNIEALISYDDDDNDEDDTPLSKTVELKIEGTTPRVLLAEGTSDAITATTTTASSARGTAAKYELTLINPESTTQTYEIKIMGASDWATYMIEAGGETSTVSLPAGQSIPVYVYLTPKADAATGQHTATVSVYANGGMTDFEVLTTDVSGTTPITGAATGITFAPTNLTTNWIIVAIVAMFGIAVAGYTVYRIKTD